MTITLETLAGNALIATAIGAVAWTVLRLARRPVLAHLLFLLALAKLVIPGVFVVGVDWPRTEPEAAEPETAAPEPAARGATHATPALSEPARNPARVVLPAASPVVQATANANAPAAPSIRAVGGALWLLGSALTAALVWRRGRRFRRATAATLPPPQWLEDQLHELLPRLGLRRAPKVALVGADIPPVVHLHRGGMRILLGRRSLDELPRSSVRTLLAHELAHVRRGDPFVRVLETAATVLWWWLPLLWLLRAGLRHAEERCCDAWVAAVLPDCRSAYCRALLHISAEPSPLPMPALASPVRRLTDWKTRLEDIMCHAVPHRPSVVTQFAAALAAAFALPFAFARAQEKQPSFDVSQRLAVEIETRLENATIDAWTAWLEKATKVPFVIDDSARQVDARRTTLTELRLPRLPANSVLDIVETITGLSCSVTSDHVLVHTPHAKAQRLCYLVGAVRDKGPRPLADADETLLGVLFAAGWTPEANLGQVALIRPAPDVPLTVVVDFGEMVRTGSTVENLVLRDGDVVFVPRRNPAPQLEAPPATGLAVGSRLRFVLYDDAARQPGCEQLELLTKPQTVGRDGKIFVPYVGHVDALGKTKDEVARMVEELYRDKFTFAVHVDALFL